MSKKIAFKEKALSVVFWSIVSAAFIGPGTVTTAAKAGASFGLALLWALVFSTLATVVLQEAAARITIATGQSLGQIIRKNYALSPRSPIPFVLFSVIFIGCAAYEAGNILGGIAGLELVWDGPRWISVTLVGGLALLLLTLGSYQDIAKILGLVVFGMGAIFIYTAFYSEVTWTEVAKHFFPISQAEGGTLLAIGLVGTTIVPYNLFLASGIGKGQTIGEMRWGIILAVIIGGVISMAILITGIQVIGEFSFQTLSETLASRIGRNGRIVFGIGLLAAGFTSTITAPLAAAITGSSLMAVDQNSSWQPGGRNYRLTYSSIILIGMVFGISGIQPIPMIILAQALNGMLLPIIALFLFRVMNDHRILPANYLNTRWLNVLTTLILTVIAFLGFYNLLLATNRLFYWADNQLVFWMAAGLALLFLLYLIQKTIGKK